MRYTLFLLLLMGFVGCDSDKPTKPFVPIETQQLIGRWDGSYSLTYNAGTDSSYTFQTDIWVVFTDSSFEFRGVDGVGPCGTWGRGTYSVKGNELWFQDECPRHTICTWENILQGRFRYDCSSDATELRMAQHLGDFLWRVELTKTPVVVPF